MLAAWATSIGVAALFYRFVESPAASRRIATAVAWPVKGLFGRGAAWAASPARIRNVSQWIYAEPLMCLERSPAP